MALSSLSAQLASLHSSNATSKDHSDAIGRGTCYSFLFVSTNNSGILCFSLLVFCLKVTCLTSICLLLFLRKRPATFDSA